MVQINGGDLSMHASIQSVGICGLAGQQKRKYAKRETYSSASAARKKYYFQFRVS